MPVMINDQKYYRTAEVYKAAGISRTTLFRWLRYGVIKDTVQRDRRGWRIFTGEELHRIKEEANRFARV